MSWDPKQYLRFADERLRPGFDLLARVGELPPGPVYDLGCGTGDHARAMAERWPDRVVHGMDASPEMLEKAGASPSTVRWRTGRIEDWSPEEPPALVFTNAVLQWLDGHDILFPRLLGALARDGVLAVQMPRNFDQPSHVLMRETATSGRWASRLAPLLREAPVAPPDVFYDRLAPLTRELEIWETEYLHVLGPSSGTESPVLSWVRGTAVRPLLAALDEAERADFIAAYDERLRKAYPTRADGRVLFPFRRLFLVARPAHA